MLQPIMLLAGLAGALLLTGGVGIVATWGGVEVGAGGVMSLVSTGFGLGLGLAIVHDLAQHRLDAEREREIKDIQAWAKRLECEAREAALVSAQAQVEALADEAEEAWRSALERFFRAGDLAGGFSIRLMSGVVGSTAWGRLTDFYCSQEGRQVLRVGPGDEGTVWGHGWNLDSTLQALATGKLPHPIGTAPEISEHGRNATRRDSTRQRKTVIEGTARAAE